MGLLIVEDHGLLAQSLTAALESESFEVAVIDASDPSVDILAQALAARPQLALLDLDLGPHGSSLPLIAPLRDDGARVLVVTGIGDPVRHAECLEAGALGVVSKSESFEQLVAIVRQALDGRPVISEHERQEQLALLRRHRADLERRFAPFERLTRREQQILGLLMDGSSAAQIADESFVSMSTVRSQIKSVLSKLGVRSQVAAIGRAREAGWQPPAD